MVSTSYGSKLPQSLHLRNDGKIVLQLRPQRPKYRALLSIDGGGVRGIIPAIVLRGFEKTVKTVARENFKEIENASDEELVVDVNDYFDMITGNSAGSILALFLASCGGSPELYEKGGILVGFEPGSAEAAIAMVNDVAMNVFKKNFFAAWLSILPNILGLFSSVYGGEGLSQGLKRIFGRLRMSDLRNNALVTAYELDNARPVAFYRQVVGNPSSGYAFPEEFDQGLILKDFPTSKAGEDRRQVPPSFGSFEFDVPLRIAAQASSSAPVYFDPVTYKEPNLSSVLGLEKDSVSWADGGLVSNDPTMVALSIMGAMYLDDETERLLSLEKMAVMSLGTGTRRAPLEIGGGKGLASWGAELIKVLMEANMWQNERIVRGVLEGKMFGNVEPEDESYIRLDKVVYPEDEHYDVLGLLDDPSKLEELEKIGQGLVDDPINQTRMKAFVENILMK